MTDPKTPFDNDERDNDQAADDKAAYDVGYGKPPTAHQFKSGKSGNPRGRPKGSKGLKAELSAEINEFVTITSNGKPRRVRMLRVVIKALAAKAAKGNVAAADKLLSLVIQAEGFEDQRPNAKPLNDTDQLILNHLLGEAVEVDVGEDDATMSDAETGHE